MQVNDLKAYRLRKKFALIFEDLFLTAKEIIEENGSLPFSIGVLCNYRINLLPAPIQPETDIDKDRIADFIASLPAEVPGLQGVLTLMEAWTVERKAADMADVKRPSEEPDRKETIVICLKMADGTTIGAAKHFTRDGNKIILSDIKEGYDQGSNRFLDRLFSENEPKTNFSLKQELREAKILHMIREILVSLFGEENSELIKSRLAGIIQTAHSEASTQEEFTASIEKQIKELIYNSNSTNQILH